MGDSNCNGTSGRVIGGGLMSPFCWFASSYGLAAIIVSVFRGYFAVEIFVPGVAPHYIPRSLLTPPAPTPVATSTPAVTSAPPPAPDWKPRSWYVHQIILNFCGSLVGWIALWFVGQKLLCAFRGDLSGITWANAGISLVAFFGVTGYLPAATVGLIKGLTKFIAEKAGD
jgi:hypothetical protein